MIKLNVCRFQLIKYNICSVELNNIQNVIPLITLGVQCWEYNPKYIYYLL